MGGSTSHPLPDRTDGTVFILINEPGIACGHITHVGIFVFGKLVEYSVEGMEITTGARNRPFRQVHLGKTLVTKFQLFNEWYLMQQYKKFPKHKFHIVKNNCIHFAQDLAEFLGVDFPQDVSEQLEWVQNYPKTTEFFSNFNSLVNGSSSNSSRR